MSAPVPAPSADGEASAAPLLVTTGHLPPLPEVVESDAPAEADVDCMDDGAGLRLPSVLSGAPAAAPTTEAPPPPPASAPVADAGASSSGTPPSPAPAAAEDAPSSAPSEAPSEAGRGGGASSSGSGSSSSIAPSSAPAAAEDAAAAPAPASAAPRGEDVDLADVWPSPAPSPAPAPEPWLGANAADPSLPAPRPVAERSGPFMAPFVDDAASSDEPVQAGPPLIPGEGPAVSLLCDFGRRMCELGKGLTAYDARAAIPPLVCMARLVPGRTTNPCPSHGDAAIALAQLMASNEENRKAVHEFGGAEVLVALIDAQATTPTMRINATHALHMLVRSPELCPIVANEVDGLLEALARMVADRGTHLAAALPAAGAVCNIAENGDEAARSKIRSLGVCDSLSSLILLMGGASAEAKFSGYALYALMQEAPTIIIEAVEKCSISEPLWGRAVEASCPELLEVLQRRIVDKLQEAVSGSNVGELENTLECGKGLLIPNSQLKDIKSKTRQVMQRQEERRLIEIAGTRMGPSALSNNREKAAKREAKKAAAAAAAAAAEAEAAAAESKAMDGGALGGGGAVQQMMAQHPHFLEALLQNPEMLKQLLHLQSTTTISGANAAKAQPPPTSKTSIGGGGPPPSASTAAAGGGATAGNIKVVAAGAGGAGGAAKRAAPPLRKLAGGAGLAAAASAPAARGAATGSTGTTARTQSQASHRPLARPASSSAESARSRK